MTEENKNPEINSDSTNASEKASENTNTALDELKVAQEQLDEAKAKVDFIKSKNPPISYTEGTPSGTNVEQSVPSQSENTSAPVLTPLPPQNSSQGYYQAPPPQQPYQQQSQQSYYYQQPQYSSPQAVTQKDHVAAGLLGIFLGGLGIHKFYLGYNTSGFIMLAVAILGGIVTCSIATWVMWIIGIIEGIMYLTKSQGEFEQIYVFSKREWF